MNLVDFIVAVVLLTPLIYGALRYHYRGRRTSKVADQMVRDLYDRSKCDCRPGAP
jgi:hypothetical protein